MKKRKALAIALAVCTFGGTVSASEIISVDGTVIEGTHDGQTGDSGGAYYNAAKNITVQNASFSNNSATSTDEKEGTGGAFTNGGTSQGSSVTVIQNSYFGNNTAHGRGGAVSNFNIIDEGILNTVFEGNKTTYVKGSGDDVTQGQGGAFYNNGEIKGAGFSGVTFKNNTTTLHGGALMNWGKISAISNSTFSGNTAVSSAGAIGGAGQIDLISNTTFSANSAEVGGAIGSRSVFKTIDNSSFIGNCATATGGAIYLYESADDNELGVIEQISNTTFSGNYTKAPAADNVAPAGSAIFNNATINKITNSNFVGNYNELDSTGTWIAYGGTIANIKTIGEITNSTFSENSSDLGGAIYNDGTINKISGTSFSSNKATVSGGAIINNSGATITLIDDVSFTNNTVKTDKAGMPLGGAIVNNGTITEIKNSHFEGNSVENSYAPAIPDDETIAFGGAVVNYGDGLKIINTDFINNTAKSVNGVANAAGLYAGENTTLTDTSFSGNKVYSKDQISGTAKVPQAAAIGVSQNKNLDIFAISKDILFKDNEIIMQTDSGEKIVKNDIYIENSATASLNAAENRTITLNGGVAGSPNSTLIINKTVDTTDYTGEIIFNEKVTPSILNLQNGTLRSGTSNYEVVAGENYRLSNIAPTTLNVNGGTIDLANDYIEQVKLSALDFAAEGDVLLDADLGLNAIDSFNATTVNTSSTPIHVKGVKLLSDSNGATNTLKFIQNTNVSTRVVAPTLFTSSHRYDGVASYDGTDTNLVLTKAENAGGLVNATAYAPASAGAHVSYTMTANETPATDLTPFNSNIETVIIFGNNKEIAAADTKGFEVAAGQSFKMSDIGKVSGFHSPNGGILYNNGGNAEIARVAFENNSSSGNGGVINTNGGNLIVTDSSFKNNSSAGKGGAIYAGGGADVIINAASTDVTFADNTASLENNSIYMDNVDGTPAGTLRLKSANGRKISLSGVSGSASGYKITINENMKDGGAVEFTDKVTNATADGGVHLYGGTLRVANDSFLNGNALSLHGCTLDMLNNSVGLMSLQSLSMENTTNLKVDVDLANKTMDRIAAASYNTGTGFLNIDEMNVLSDANPRRTSVLFSGSSLGNVELTDHITTTVTKVKGPVYVYNVSGTKNGTDYVFNFDHSGHMDDYNPAIYVGAVAAQLGGYANQLNLYQTAFGTMDSLMSMSAEQREAYKNANKYAQADKNSQMLYSPTNTPVSDNYGIWFKPYTSIEKVPLKNGPDVNNFMYGGLVGGDTGIKDLGHGWSGIANFFGGYTGSKQSFDGINMYQNGGTLGMSGMLFKNNFFGGITANIGGSGVDANTDIGKENFGLFTTGAALKGGYNWEFLKGKLVLQPNLMASYSFVKASNYDNSYGVRVESKGLNAIQIAPGLKLIGNLKNNWQPFIGASFMWNILDKTKFDVADVSVPELAIKPYIEYGAGVQKKIGERFTGYAQVTARNIGRNGVAFGLGGRWELGK